MFGRKDAAFPRLVEKHFAFLGELGFRITKREPTFVRYARNGVFAHIYHGRKSHELNFEVWRGEQGYSIGTILDALGAPGATHYRNATAKTEEAIDAGLTRLAQLAAAHAQPVLRGESRALEALEAWSQKWSDAYAMEVLSRRRTDR